MDTTNATLLKNTAPYDLLTSNRHLATFVTRSDDDEPQKFLTIDPELFDALGRPETITVTIEPGDKLNS